MNDADVFLCSISIIRLCIIILKYVYFLFFKIFNIATLQGSNFTIRMTNNHTLIVCRA